LRFDENQDYLPLGAFAAQTSKAGRQAEFNEKPPYRMNQYAFISSPATIFSIKAGDSGLRHFG
jgi:hypothetical protein